MGGSRAAAYVDCNRADVSRYRQGFKVQRFKVQGSAVKVQQSGFLGRVPFARAETILHEPRLNLEP